MGIKVVNQIFKSEMLEYPLFSQSIGEMSTQMLQLSVDGLKDRHTLLGTAIGDSPHVSLVRALQSGEDIRTNSYVERARAGTLDLRGPRKVSAAFLKSLHECFATQIAAAEAGTSPPVKVVEVAGQFYIADGKHRAAVYDLLGRSAPCQDVTPVLYDSFFWWIRRKMKSHAIEYQKHLQFFELADRAIRPERSEVSQ